MADGAALVRYMRGAANAAVTKSSRSCAALRERGRYVCHLESAEGTQRLLARASRALRPSGVLVVVDTVPDDRRVASLAVRLQNLRQGLRTDRGELHDAEHYRRWLVRTGFECTQLIRLRDGTKELAALIGKRTAAVVGVSADVSAMGELPCTV